MRRVGLLRLSGGVAGIMICFGPVLLLESTALDGRSSTRAMAELPLYLLAATLDLARAHGPFVVRIDSHFSWDFGAPLALLPGALWIWLLAPLVCYRRRDALLAFVPILNLYIAWVLGSRLAALGSYRGPSGSGRLDESGLVSRAPPAEPSHGGPGSRI